MQGNASSATSGPVPDINVTPLIDVLLVLLIIFMVIVPTLPRGLEGALPQQPAKDAVTQVPVRLSVRGESAGGVRYAINDKGVAGGELSATLQAILAGRSERVVVLSADRRLSYQQVAEAMGVSHAAGASNIVFERLSVAK